MGFASLGCTMLGGHIAPWDQAFLIKSIRLSSSKLLNYPRLTCDRQTDPGPASRVWVGRRSVSFSTTLLRRTAYSEHDKHCRRAVRKAATVPRIISSSYILVGV